jgi:multidrug efflux pump subunit AcrA (membrane-fusion protein)
MSAITTRMPGGATRGLSRLGPLNGVLAVLIVAAGVGAYWAVTATKTAAPSVRTATVSKGVVLSTVSATGALQSPSQIAVGFSSAGTLTAIAVKPGENVKRGQVLGAIDATDAKQAVRQAAASLATAHAQYETTLTGETAQQRAQDALAVTQARQSVSQAKTGLTAARQTAKLDKQSSAASVSQARRQLAVDQGQLKRDLAQRDKDRVPYATTDAASAAVTADKVQLTADQNAQHADQLAQLDAQNQQSRDQASLADAKAGGSASLVSVYTNAVNQDQYTLDFLQKKLSEDAWAISQDQSKLTTDQGYLTALQSDEQAIRSDEQKIAQDNQAVANAKQNAAATAQKDAQSIESARRQIPSAQLSLKSTLAGNAVKQAPPTAAALAGAKASVLQAQIALDKARKTLRQTTLRAPIAGVVASVDGAVGTTVAGSGTTMAAASSASSAAASSPSGFVTLTKLTGMQIVASFSETDAAKLKVGQPATVTVDALPNKQLAAHVIAVAATAATSTSNVVTYDVTFALDRTSSRLKPGMTANVDVVIGEQDNVLHVPTAAVTGSGSNASVTVLRNGVQQRVTVVAGLKGDSSTTILSGLKATDSVVIPSVSITSSSSTSPTGGGPPSFGGGGIGGGGFGARLGG